MNTDFLCERALQEQNPYYSELVKNTSFVLYHALENYKLVFKDYTDHTILHSIQVMDFCNKLIGENIRQMNEDELYVLIMAVYLHDCGMGISEKDYRNFYEKVVEKNASSAHPVESIRETIRDFHQSFSRHLIEKYAPLFDIPTPEHVQAIAAVSEAHRRMDLLDPNILPDSMSMPSGNTVRLPYLAALVRLADELDIAADRNLCTGALEADTIFKQMHQAIRHLHMEKDSFVLEVVADDPALFDSICKEIRKLQNTLTNCRQVVSARTPFTISQETVRIDRIPSGKRSLTVLDTDLGTDDACALLVLKDLPKKPDYIVTAYGNTRLDDTVRNALVLKKYLGLPSQIVRGVPVPENPEYPIAEKGEFHGPDGLAGCAEQLEKKVGLTEEEQESVIPFDSFLEKLREAESITYITIGTLSNLKELLQDEKIRGNLTGIYCMGGGLAEFNCKNNTEFNFSKDPSAVKALLESGRNITLFPLDITNHQRLTGEEIDALEALGTYPEYIRFLRHNMEANIEYNHIPTAVLHDVLPVLYCAHPELFTLTDMRISSNQYGSTYTSGDGTAVHVCTGLKEGTLQKFMQNAFRDRKDDVL